MEYTSLGYLYFPLKNKVKYRYIIRLSKLDSIYIYNFESIVEVIK